MHAIGGVLLWSLSHTLGGIDVQEHRVVVWRIPQLLEDGYQVIDIMPVDQSHVIKYQIFKQCPYQYNGPGVFVNTLIERLHLLQEELIKTLVPYLVQDRLGKGHALSGKYGRGLISGAKGPMNVFPALAESRYAPI